MLNPAEPPVMMRNTVHVMVDAEEVDEAAITDSIQAMVERVQQYVPGYTLKSRPLFDRNRVSILLEVTGAGDYLPTYAGNLDIMTAVAVRSGKTWQVEVGKAALKRGKLAVLHIPGIGIKEDLQQARAHGAQMARICTHCTEADICEQHMRLSKQMGMEVVGFLMLAHMLDPRGLVEQARKMESCGVDVAVLADSAGAMTPDDVRARVRALLIPIGSRPWLDDAVDHELLAVQHVEVRGEHAVVGPDTPS